MRTRGEHRAAACPTTLTWAGVGAPDVRGCGLPAPAPPRFPAPGLGTQSAPHQPLYGHTGAGRKGKGFQKGAGPPQSIMGGGGFGLSRRGWPLCGQTPPPSHTHSRGGVGVPDVLGYSLEGSHVRGRQAPSGVCGSAPAPGGRHDLGSILTPGPEILPTTCPEGLPCPADPLSVLKGRGEPGGQVFTE